MNTKQITVTYTLTEEQAERMKKLTETWNASNKTHYKSTPEGLFEFMMELGSTHDINKKLDYFEEYANKITEIEK